MPQIAELTRGQLSLQTQMQTQPSQLWGLITALNTIIFASLPAKTPLLALGGTAPAAKQEYQRQLPKQPRQKQLPPQQWQKHMRAQ